MNLKTLIFIFLLGSIFYSCKRDKIDFGMIDDLTLNPELEAPLVKARLSLNDIVVRDSGRTLQVDEDDLVRIKYLAEDLFSFSVLDFVNIPNQDAVSLPLVVGSPPFDLDMSLGTVGGVDLFEATISEGFLRLELSTSDPLPEAAELALSFKNANSPQGSLIGNIILPAGVTRVIDSVDLNSVEFDFSNGGQSTNYIGLTAQIINYDPVLIGEILDLELRFERLAVQDARGFFGERIVNIPDGNFDFDISGLEDLFDGFYLKEPTISLITASTVGVGLELNPKLTGVNIAGDLLPLSAEPEYIPSAQNVSTISYDTIEYNPNNSKVDEFLAGLPNEVLYSGNALINPNGSTDTNFINENSEIKIGVEVDIPLELSIDNMRLQQELSGIDLFGENPDEIESLTLIFHTSNGFPFSLDLSVAFLETQAPHDSLHGFNLGLLSAATTDANGQIVQRGEPAPQSVTLDAEVIEKLKNSDRIRFKAAISTEESGQKIEKFYTNFDLEIRVAAKAKLNLKMSEE